VAKKGRQSPGASPGPSRRQLRHCESCEEEKDSQEVCQKVCKEIKEGCQTFTRQKKRKWPSLKAVVH
jgi:hypothetical protein